MQRAVGRNAYPHGGQSGYVSGVQVQSRHSVPGCLTLGDHSASNNNMAAITGCIRFLPTYTVAATVHLWLNDYSTLNMSQFVHKSIPVSSSSEPRERLKATSVY